MENKPGPGDHKNTAGTAGEYHVSLSDLEPTRGITDCLDDVIFGLCDTSHATTLNIGPAGNGTTCISNKQGLLGHTQFCQHLRLTTNADTVYLCERKSLRITTSTSNEFAEDTEEMHLALTSAICNLHDCCEAFQLPLVRVFPDHPKLAFTVIPVAHPSDLKAQSLSPGTAEYLAIIVDADEEYREANPCIAEAVQAIYNAFTVASPLPTNKQIQRAVFDQLKRNCSLCSNRITARRHEIFVEDLMHVTVHFEKLLAANAISSDAISGTVIGSTSVPPTEEPVDPFVWGWQSVASLIENDRYPHALYQQAELWGETFTTDLDTHILREATLRYKEVCEAANLHSFDSIKPLCVTVYPQTLIQDSYLDTLQQLMEMAVIRGEQLVLKLSERTSICADAMETETELCLYKKHLQACCNRFGVQFGLGEFGTGHSSVLRLTTLNPHVIKLSAALLPDCPLSIDEWVDTVSRMSLVAGTRASNSNDLTPAQILIDGSQLPSTSDSLQRQFVEPETDSAAITA